VRRGGVMNRGCHLTLHVCCMRRVAAAKRVDSRRAGEEE